MTCQFVDDGRIQMLDRVGKGGWGVVYRARDLSAKESQQIVAVKVILKPSHKSFRSKFLLREIENLRTMSKDSKVVGMRRVFTDKIFVYIVLDYCPGGDMWRAIADHQIFARNDERLRNVFLQLIDAVAACHKRGIYHRDLKPNNVLITVDLARVVLSDFGLSTRAKHTGTFRTGTGPYKSPGKFPSFYSKTLQLTSVQSVTTSAVHTRRTAPSATTSGHLVSS